MKLPLVKLASYSTQTGEKKGIDIIAEQIEKYFHINIRDCKDMTLGELVALMDELDTYAQIISADTARLKSSASGSADIQRHKRQRILRLSEHTLHRLKHQIPCQ